MKQVLTIVCKLQPTKEQASQIEDTLAGFANACNHINKDKKPTSATLCKHKDGNYYIHIQIKDDVPETSEPESTIGVDLGKRDKDVSGLLPDSVLLCAVGESPVTERAGLAYINNWCSVEVSKALRPSPSPAGEGNKKNIGFAPLLLRENGVGEEGSA